MSLNLCIADITDHKGFWKVIRRVTNPNALGGFTSTVDLDISFDEYSSLCMTHSCNSFSSWAMNNSTYKYCYCLFAYMNENSNSVQLFKFIIEVILYSNPVSLENTTY